MVLSTEFEEEIFDKFDFLLDLLYTFFTRELGFVLSVFSKKVIWFTLKYINYEVLNLNKYDPVSSVDKDTIKGLEEIYVPNKNVSLV